MITRLSYQLANKIANATSRDDEDFIRYGLEITFIALFKLLVFLCIAIFFDVIIEMFVIVSTFAMLRRVSGGAHMSTYLRCLSSSILLFFTPTLIFKYLAIDINLNILLLLTFVIAVAIIIIYVPVQAVNRPIPKERYLYFKKMSILYLFLWLIINIIVIRYIPQYSKLSMLSAFGIIIQVFTLLPFGFKLITNIDNFLNK